MKGPRIFRYLFRYRYRVLIGVLLSLIVSLTNLVSLTAFVPIFNALGSEEKVVLFDIGGQEKASYDDYLAGKDQPLYVSLNARITGFKLAANEKAASMNSRELVFFLAKFILPVYILKLVCLTLTIYFIGTAGAYAARDLRMDLYRKFGELSITYFDQGRTGFLMSRILNDVQLVSRSLSVEFQEGITNLLYIFTHLALLAIISWKMLLVILFGVPLIMSPVNRIARKVRKAALGQQERLADMMAHLQEIISGIRVIRAFAMEKFEEMRFSMINEKLYRDTYRGHYYHQVSPALSDIVVTMMAMLFIAWAAFMISEGQLDRGLFFAFFLILMFVMRPATQISVMINLVSAAGAAAERIFEILDLPPDPASRGGSAIFRGFQSTIRFENVSFRYPDKEEFVLKKIDFEIKKGQTVSLVGYSGGGKSTTVDLLMRFYDPEKGRILLDGTDIREFSVRDLRRCIGIVTQNVFLFNGTIAENIALAQPDAPRERIEECARAAYAHDFIIELPAGYDTIVGERGVMLSGGQRQRIAVARALLHDPDILIFDEATSALDNESEKMFEEAIDRLTRIKTVIMIAHRLRTVFRSDQIFVFERGEIVERGTHDELLQKNGHYRKLYELQFSENHGV
jgi:ATP-binding cassette subfamily B protein/subfamily B ATP-binding cassette protein MsbA